MATDKLDAEKWAKRYEEICCEVYKLPLPPMDEKLDEEENSNFCSRLSFSTPKPCVAFSPSFLSPQQER